MKRRAPLIALCWSLLSCSSSTNAIGQQPTTEAVAAVRRAYFESRIAKVCTGRDGVQGEDAAESRRLEHILNSAIGTPFGPLVKALNAEWIDLAPRADWSCPPGNVLARFREANERLAQALSET